MLSNRRTIFEKPWLFFARAVYISIDPDWSEEDVGNEAKKIIAALK